MVKYNDLNFQEQRIVQEQMYKDVKADALINTNAYMEELKPKIFQLIHEIFKKSYFDIKDTEFDVVYVPELKRYTIDIVDRIARYKPHESVTVDVDNFNCRCTPVHVNLRGYKGLLFNANDTDVECNFEFAEYDENSILHDNATIPENVFTTFVTNDKVVNMTKEVAGKWNVVVNRVNHILFNTAELYNINYSKGCDNLVVEKLRENPEINEL